MQRGDGGVGGPAPDADPRSIVQGFLTANGDTDSQPHRSQGIPDLGGARDLVRSSWRRSWSALTVGNVVFGKRTPGSAVPETSTITVTGHEAGTVDETGTYKPFLRGNGSGNGGGGALAEGFGLKRVKGEWRIDSLPAGAGLLLTTTQFQAFTQYAVYFFDANDQDLVPTPRYTLLSAPQDLVPWLVKQQLADQPPDQLNSGFPPGGANNVKVSVPPDPSDPSQPIVIEIPGASALDGASLDRLASEIGATLKQVLQVDRIQITDGGKPVRIPIAHGTSSPPSRSPTDTSR